MKTQSTIERNDQAHGELSDEQLDTVAGGFFSDIIRRGMAIEEAKNHPVLQGLKELVK